MPRIEASLEDAQGSVILPDRKWQHMIVAEKPVVQMTKGNVQTGSRAGNPMATLTLEVADGPFKSARVFGHNIMLGGTTSKGGPMPLRNLVEFLDAMAADGCSWECLNCHQVGDNRFEKGANGTKLAGQYMCPNCHERSRFGFDTDDWTGHRLNALINTGTFFNSNEPRNEIARVAPYDDIDETEEAA